MATSQYRDNRNQGDRRNFQQRESIADRAEKFIPPIKAMLSLEKASAAEIKNGISTINDMLLKNKTVTAHQVRNIFSLINEIDPDNMNNESMKKLNMLRPRLAYIGARQTNDDGKIIVQVLDQLIISFTDEPNTSIVKEKIAGLRYIMESIVAYHKFHSKN